MANRKSQVWELFLAQRGADLVSGAADDRGGGVRAERLQVLTAAVDHHHVLHGAVIDVHLLVHLQVHHVGLGQMVTDLPVGPTLDKSGGHFM